VRSTAYQLLQQAIAEEVEPVLKKKVEKAIANGVLLNAGDAIYGVYQSAVYFDDEFFHLDPDFNEMDSIDEIDWEELGYADYEDFCLSEHKSYSTGEIESFVPKRIARYLSKSQAEVAAEQLHQKLASEFNYNYSEFEWKSDFVFDEWCEADRISDIDEYEYLCKLQEDLKAKGNYELLGKLWRDSVGDLTFVREETVTEPRYLKIEQ
jgi:hypothetical protein